ncbi:MAG: hypothetical protein AAGF11_39125 [Myxococcota bacterium]
MSDASSFTTLPLDEQLQWLEAALERREDPRDLLRTCAAVRDHAPLAWLARHLLTRGWLRGADEQAFMARFLLKQPETAVDRVLKALVGDGTLGARHGPSLRDTLLAILRQVTIDQVSVMCLVDRALKHNFVEARDAHVKTLTEQCAEALGQGRADEVTVDHLAQVSAPGIARLRERAAAHGPATAQQLEQTLHTLARRTIEVLGRAPKAVSQANAEELLSKRVYTDPGHFLVELLQNAEDAGARCFRLQFTPHRIVLWHDGKPFDTRDVVGVTSIGQTTKRKQQIGFFGVGFKSVYEVTDRPRIYSDVYHFEIADVSIPKALSARGDDLPAEGTVLVLPLRDPKDEERSPAALYAKARDLDAIVLFTLRRIDVIELELHDEHGQITRHAVHELSPDARGISRIRQEPEGWVRGYAVHDAEHVYSGGLRAPGRADRTRVMVGLRVDEHGVPRALEADTPTIYSYLPTEEHSGLRFFVQGHFDVPVDRERITQDSRWNRWILSKVPEGLAQLTRQLTSEHEPDHHKARVAEGLLGVLPQASELGSPIFRRVVGGLRSAFASLPVVPCDDGSLQAPGAVLLADEALGSLLAGEPVPTAEGPRHLARRDLAPRALEAAQMLGATRYAVSHLIDDLERTLGPLADGARVDRDDTPRFIREPTADSMAACYELLNEAVTRRGGTGTRRLTDLSTLRRLRALPLVLSVSGALHRPGPAIVRATPALRSIYAGLRAFVHADLDAAVDPEDGRRATPTAFLERLSVRELGVRELVQDLEAALGDHPGPLTDLSTTRIPGSRERLLAVLTLLAGAPPTLQRRVTRLPLFLAQDGRYHRAAAKAGDPHGVLLFEPGPLAEQLLAYYGDARPVYRPTEDDPALALLRNARTPALSLSSLVADLRPRLRTLSAEDLDRLHALLEAVRDELPERTRRELAELPIWPDTQGTRRPLRGQGAVALPGSPAIATLLPEVAFLHPSVLARAHSRDMGGEVVGLEVLVDALSADAPAPRRIEPTTASVSAVLEVLVAARDEIHPKLRDRLAKTPAFLDDAGRPCRLDALCLAEDPALRAIYGDWPERRFVDPNSPTHRAIEALDLDGRLTRTDTTTLAADLAALSPRLDGASLDEGPLPLVGDRAHLRSLLGHCAAQAPALPRTVVHTLARAAIFEDLHGRLGPLGDAGSPGRAEQVYACAPALRGIFVVAGIRLVAEELQVTIGPLLDATNRHPLDVINLVEYLEPLTTITAGQPRPAVQAPEHLATIQEILAGHAAVLARRFGPQAREGAPPSSATLGELAIWGTKAGGVITAHDAVVSPALASLLPPATPARRRLDEVTPDPEAAARLEQLHPLVVPASGPTFAASLVRAAAIVGEPMSAQPSWLGSVTAVARLAAFIGPDGRPRPLVDATERLRLEPGQDLGQDLGQEQGQAPLLTAPVETVALLEGTAMATRLLHPELAAALPETTEWPAVEPATVIDALVADHEEPGPVGRHPILHDPARRARFYQWLCTHESTIFTDARARMLLRTRPLLLTDRDTLRPADQLVIDPDLPQLDVDWTPHAELPEPALSLLVRHLGVGRPPMEDLVVDHLAPAYHRATHGADGPGAARLLEYLARALSSTPSDEVRSLLGGAGPVLVEGAHARFVPATTLLLPPAELRAAAEAVFGATHPVPHPRLPATTQGLLEALGVARLPPRRWVADAMRGGVASAAIATGLAILVAHLHRDDPAATVAELPLREVAWVLDGHGVARRPSELLAWTADVQALVGDAPGLYPAPEIARALGESLSTAIGLRSAADVRLPEVVAHIDASQEAGIPLPFVVYAWLERGLTEGWLDGAQLRRQLAGRAWICSDDGEYHPHERVLGLRALEHFGTRRGYWERGRQHCPTLCRVFGIPDRLTPAVLLAFVEQINDEAEIQGDQALLTAEPGLPRMLLRAYATLGSQGEPAPARSILCRQCGGDQPGALHLRPPEDPLVLRSDAPTLEAMFAAAGRFFVASPGPAEDRAEIDFYYERCGVRRLRQRYEIRVVDTGEDQSRAHADAIRTLRTSLLGLWATLPRVRLQRTHLLSEAWVYEERLATLARTGPIAARVDLEVDYVLPGVGQARTRAMAVYDPSAGALLVDTRVLVDPATTVTGLAQGVMACIYDGPGEEQLVDIVEILLRLGDRSRMDDYLDRRFFPTAAEPQVGSGGRLAARVGELFDYGLDRRLTQRFDALADRPLERWRDPSLFVGLPDEQEPAVRTVVARMLAAIELTRADQALTEALALLLSAPSLSDVPAGLLAPEASSPTASGHPRPDHAAPSSTTLATTELSGERPGDPSGEPLELPSLAELEERLAELTAQASSAGSPGDSPPHRFVLPDGLGTLGDGNANPDTATLPGYGTLVDDDDTTSPPFPGPSDGPSGGPRRGFWSRLARRLGLLDDASLPESPPPWATPGANVLGPTDFIGPQLWVRGRTLRKMATERIPMGLLHEPPVLPSPYRYVVHTMGGAFQPDTQQWHPVALPAVSALFGGEPTGATVSWAGRLAPGRSVLPIPLYGDVTRLEVVDADPSVVRPAGRLPAGSALVDVSGSQSVQIRYEVGLRRPPTLTDGATASGEALVRPTLARDDLPGPVRDWIDRNRSPERGAWEQARRAEAFVQRRYVYDLEFRERPEVEREAQALRPGVGNHHLALLHASGDREVLGRGVCYELNVLVVELLRHLGVPSLVALGWMLDEGFADRPDHLFALALVPSVTGPCLLPLDASTGPRGPVRPLAGAEPPAVSLAPPERPPIPDADGGWAAALLPGPERDVAIDEHVHAIHRSMRATLDREREALRRAIRIADTAHGRSPSTLESLDDVARLRGRAITALGNESLLAPLLAVIRGDFDYATTVPESVQALIRSGLATVETHPSYHVRPIDMRDPPA